MTNHERIVSVLCMLMLPVSASAQSFAYVANKGSDNVSAYSINETTGVLTPTVPATFSTGSLPWSVTVDPKGKFAYVVNNNSASVSAYTINPITGVLTPTVPATFGTGAFPQSVTVDPTGKFAYVANSVSNNVSAYGINATTGVLTPTIPPTFAAGNGPSSITLDPMGKFAYVTNQGGDEVSAYTINATTGVLTPTVPATFTTGGAPKSVTVDPTGKFAYVANNNSANISAYTINPTTGVLTPTAPATFGAGSFPYSVAVHPNGKFLYLVNNNSNNVSVYPINPATGVLGVPALFATGAFPQSIALNETGEFAYVANSVSANVSAYTINATTGALTPTVPPTFNALVGPTSVVTTRRARNAFLVSYASNLTQGDSVINLTNTGVNGASLYGPGFGVPAGNICVNVYAFSPDEQLVSCCSCLVTPNGLVNLTANRDLVSNTLTGIRPNSLVVKLVSTGANADFTGSSCTNSAALAGSDVFPLAGGILAWGTTLHSATSVEPPPVGTPFSITETPFLPATLSSDELKSIVSRCTNIVGNGSTFGQCRSCRLGGLGGSKL